MIRLALRMLLGDRAKYLMLVGGLTFSALLMTQQTAVFQGLLSWTTSHMRNIRASIWVVESRVEQVNETKNALIARLYPNETAVANPVSVAPGNTTFAACMLVMDDNHRLTEWMPAVVCSAGQRDHIHDHGHRRECNRDGGSEKICEHLFPLEVLGWVNILSPLFHMSVALALLLLVNGVWGSGFSLAQLAVPLIVLPYAIMMLGLTWVFAAFGVYVRDLAQLVGPLIMMTMFLGPIFFPRSAMPLAMQPWLALNPITIPIEQVRAAVFEAHWPEWTILLEYSLVALLIYLFGLWVFASLKKGFADVI